MEEKEDKGLDVFVKKIVIERGLERPSNHLTDSVLSKIKLVDIKAVTTYKPLISKSSWVVLIFLVLVVITYFTAINPDLGNGWWTTTPVMKWSIPSNLSLNMMRLSISDTYVYAFLGLALFVGIQVLILKNYFSARYEFN